MTCSSQLLSLLLSLSPSPEEVSGLYLSPAWRQLLLQHVGIPVRGEEFFFSVARMLVHSDPCCCSVSQSCLTLCDPLDYSMPDFSVLHYLPEFAQTHVIQPSHPLSSPLRLPSVFPNIRVFSIELALHIRWTKYWSFSIRLSKEYSGLISLRLTGLIFLLSKGLSRVFSNTTVVKQIPTATPCSPHPP